MKFDKLVATLLTVLMTGATFLSPVLAQTTLGTYPDFLGTNTYIIVGAGASTSDVVGAIDLGADIQQLSVQEKTVPSVSPVPTISGGVSFDTADTKLYLTDVTNKAKSILTSTNLPDLLKSGSVEDTAGTKYTYTQYLNLGGKTIQYAQPDVASGLKDPAYLVKLGTDPSSGYLVQAWVSFTKAFNASNAVGKELTLFGKTFTISSETDPSKLVLFGLAGKDTIAAGETKTITVGGVDHTVTAVGIIDASSAVLSVDGVQKEVTEGTTYDFAGTSVYVSDVFYYKVPTETGSVVVSIGADRYVLQNNTIIKTGTSGNEVDIKGTYVLLSTSPQALSDLKISFDAYSATPAVDYIKAGTVWTDPLFGMKVAYDGPAPADSEDIVIQPGATSYYTMTFTDKYGNAGTVSWVYDLHPESSGGETLADSTGKVIHVVENESAAVSEYVFATASTFPHMLKVASLDTSANPKTVTFKDVFSGTEYKATNTTGSLVIDGQSYTVTFGSSVVSIADSVTTKTVVYPTLETQYGAKLALTKVTNVTVPDSGTGISSVVLTLPTGDATVYYNSSSTTIANVSGDATEPYKIGQLSYNMSVPDATHITVGLATTTKPAVILVEEKAKDTTVNDAAVIYATDDATTDKRLELQPITYTHDSANIYSDVGTASTYVTHAVTEWGTKVVYDTTAAGTATITYPDTQVYHSIGVGSDPVWTTAGGTTGATYKEMVPITTSIAKLDSEIMDFATWNIIDPTATAKNLVLVGGPSVNGLVAKLVRDGTLNETYAAGGSAWTANTAYVIALDGAFTTGKVVLIVAGTTADDTRLATGVLSSGNLPTTCSAVSACKITGTLTSPVGTPV